MPLQYRDPELSWVIIFLGRCFICQESFQRHHMYVYSTNGLVRAGVFLSDSYFFLSYFGLAWLKHKKVEWLPYSHTLSQCLSTSRLPIFLFQPLRRPHGFLLAYFEVSQLRGACCEVFAANMWAADFRSEVLHVGGQDPSNSNQLASCPFNPPPVCGAPLRHFPTALSLTTKSLLTMGDRKITVVSVPRALCQPSVVLAGEVRRLLFFSSLQFLNETSSLFSLIHTKTQSKKSAEMANFCCLSDGNHAKPRSLAWCLPETINRAVLLKPQPKVVRQSLNRGGCFGVCWPSMVAIRNSKFCWVTCLVWGFIAEVPYFRIYHQMLWRLFLGASWPFFRIGREPWNTD